MVLLALGAGRNTCDIERDKVGPCRAMGSGPVVWTIERNQVEGPLHASCSFTDVASFDTTGPRTVKPSEVVGSDPSTPLIKGKDPVTGCALPATGVNPTLLFEQVSST